MSGVIRNRLIDAIEAKGYSILDTYVVADRMWETILHVYVTDTDEEIGEYDTDDGTWIDENYEPEDEPEITAADLHDYMYGI